VVLAGRLYTRRELDAAAARSLGHYEAWPLRTVARWAAQHTIDETARNFTGPGID